MTTRILDVNDIAEAIQKINYCVGILKESDCSKADVNVLDVINILENNSKKISEYFGTANNGKIGSEYLD